MTWDLWIVMGQIRGQQLYHSPSTNDVKRVTVAALRRPAGKLKPILSNLSLNDRPPFLDLALQTKKTYPQRLNTHVNTLTNSTLIIGIKNGIQEWVKQVEINISRPRNMNEVCNMMQSWKSKHSDYGNDTCGSRSKKGRNSLCLLVCHSIVMIRDCYVCILIDNDEWYHGINLQPLTYLVVTTMGHVFSRPMCGERLDEAFILDCHQQEQGPDLSSYRSSTHKYPISHCLSPLTELW